LNYFLTPWFSGYWTFPNPKYKSEEICDALLIWGDVVFIIQVKTRKGIKSDGEWAKYKIKEEKERILRWVQRLKKEESIILRNKYREIVFPREEIKWYYGLVVLNHVSDPYDANEFLKEDSSEQELAIQAISLVDIYNLMKYINTPWDFVNYLESRYRLSQKTSIKVHEEGNNFGQNLSRMFHEAKEDIGEEHADKWDKFMDITIKAVNGDFQEGDPDLRRYASSFLIDSVIGGVLYKAQRDKHGNCIINDEFKLLIKSVEKLTEMNRLIRSFWGERFLIEAEKALASGETEYVTGQSPGRKMAYGFVATDKLNDERVALIKSVAREALVKNDKREGVIVAASPANIFATYQMFISWFTRGKSDYLKTNRIETLDSTILYIFL
jgi:hypothetical protein